MLMAILMLAYTSNVPFGLRTGAVEVNYPRLSRHRMQNHLIICELS